ncbi:MAG: OmpA family protein [Microscillaceae bacterium]|jgi:outer membrane protein OmpA-like peptidoglycan-associated protein|nr:OmpA family protein [Microscillaceae bacterium]
MKIIHKTLGLVWLGCWLFATNLTAQTPYAAYNVDSDGDGVPDVRDKCPDTDKNLNGHEFEAEVNGKKMFVKITDLKGGFQNRRRRFLVENSRLEKEKKTLIESVRGKIERLSDEQRNRLSIIDTSLAKNKAHLKDLIYEAKVKVEGKEQIVELHIGVDEFGCLPDRDGDGVPDMVDKCPDLPGIKALDGCRDRDGDTVLDHVDDCPDEPGLVRLKGCPDKGLGDRDKDGVIDKDDVCPDVPGPKDNKGCPKLVNKEQEEIINKASKVLFATALADLRPESLDILDKLAQVIFDLTQKYGKLAIRLEGHTDSDGTNEMNLELSRARARSVRDYLVSRGVDAFTIATAGYGEERPIDTNATPQGKQNNRRTDIVITTAPK